MKLKKGDEIIVTTGKDRGRRGKIDQALPKINKVVILGINLYKRHLKRRDEKNPGGIVEFPRPLPESNVALICPKCKKPTRVEYFIAKNEKHRICKKCKQIL